MYLLCIIFAFANTWLLQNVRATFLQTKILLLIASTPLALQAMLRGDLGSDTLGYRNYFAYRAEYGPFEFLDNDIYGFEIGFDLLTRIFILLNFNFELYQAGLALIISILIIEFFRKKTKHYAECFFLVICMFIFFSFYNVQRQCLAIVVFYYGLSRDNISSKYITIMLSCLIHYALIPISILYVLYSNNRYLKLNDLFLAVLFIAGFSVIFIVFSELLSNTTFSGYLSKTGIFNIGLNPGLGSFATLAYSILCGWLIWQYSSKNSFTRFASFSWILIYFLFSSNPFILRFGLTLQFGMVALVAILFAGPVRKSKFIDKLILYNSSLFLFGVYLINNTSEILFINE